VSAVRFRGAFILNRTDSNFGWFVWAESSDSAACSNIMGIFTKPKVKYERIIEQGGEYVL